ncbi:MAG: hypothetical protein AB7F37_10330 [Variibacter sp.]
MRPPFRAGARSATFQVFAYFVGVAGLPRGVLGCFSVAEDEPLSPPPPPPVPAFEPPPLRFMEPVLPFMEPVFPAFDGLFLFIVVPCWEGVALDEPLSPPAPPPVPAGLFDCAKAGTAISAKANDVPIRIFFILASPGFPRVSQSTNGRRERSDTNADVAKINREK